MWAIDRLDAALAGPYLVVGYGRGLLEVNDVSDPSRPHEITVPDETESGGLGKAAVAARGATAWSVDTEGGVQVLPLDLLSSAPPADKRTLLDTFDEASCLAALSDTTAVVSQLVDVNGARVPVLRVFERSPRGELVARGQVDLPLPSSSPTDPCSVAADSQSHMAVVALKSDERSWLHVVSLADLDHPARVGLAELPAAADAIDLSGDRLLTFDDSSGLMWWRLVGSDGGGR